MAEHPFPVVGVGASAGGLTPLTQLIAAMPPRPGLSLVVIQHLDPHYESRLSSLLEPHTSMTVVEAVHGAKVASDHIYVIQPNTNVAIADGVLSVTMRPESRRPHYPVDHFLRSLASVQGPYAVGVILSGTGSDGTLGICEVKAAGGVTFAQDQSAQHSGMPESAIASGAIDLILPPPEIAARLSALAQHPYVADGRAVEDTAEEPGEFQRVITALRRTSGVDFSQYRDTTIKRRTARRMLLRGFVSPDDYARFLERDSAEAQALYRDVLINVTSFFRDPEVFDALKEQVFPAIVGAKAEPGPIRIWVPGCSTGQEAYSLAMVLIEYLEAANAKQTLQIFATDLGDPAALEKARAGIYPESIEAEVTPERLRRFFVREERGYRIQKARPRPVRVRPAERHRRPAVLARRPHLLPQRADLHVAGAAGTAPAGVPFRVELRRVPGPRTGRNGRPLRRPVRSRRSRPQDLPQEGIGQPAAADVPGRRMAGRHASQATRAVRSAAARPASAKPTGWRWPATPRRACWSTTTSRSCSSGAAPRRFSRRPPGSRPPTSFAWPRKGCSWSCALP